MRLLLALTYYRPHISGLTIYAQRLSTALAQRGYTVTILTSQYNPALPQREVCNGVRVVRAPVVARVSKGVLMPTFGWLASALAPHHDAMNLHLPQFDASGLALRGRLLRQPVILTYQCDLRMPPGAFNRAANIAINASNAIAARLATTIVVSSHDYAAHSRFLSRFAHKLRVIPAPIEMPAPIPDAVQSFRDRWHSTGPIIGMAARFAAEKGVEVLLHALPHILSHHPDARVLYVGPYQHIIGEEAYARRLQPRIRRYQQQWTFLGRLSDAEMSAFFASCDVLVVPSLNTTEAFGLVQGEAMLCGTPCVASDLPGVRQPVQQTGMGLLFPPGDSRALATALLRVLHQREQYVRPHATVATHFSTERTADEYERLFAETMRR